MESFQECGWPAIAILLLSVLALGAGVVAIILAATRHPRAGVVLSGLALVMALGALAGGPLGAAYGRRFVDDVVSGESISPEQRERIREIGYAEAGKCIPVGLSLGAVPALISFVALGLSLAAGRRQSAGAGPGDAGA